MRSSTAEPGALPAPLDGGANGAGVRSGSDISLDQEGPPSLRLVHDFLRPPEPVRAPPWNEGRVRGPLCHSKEQLPPHKETFGGCPLGRVATPLARHVDATKGLEGHPRTGRMDLRLPLNKRWNSGRAVMTANASPSRATLSSGPSNWLPTRLATSSRVRMTLGRCDHRYLTRALFTVRTLRQLESLL